MLHRPSICSLGDLAPKKFKLNLQETKERILIDLDYFHYKQNYLFPSKS
jgi:hypothetical protein